MADNCGSYVSAEDLQAAKQSILHIEHVATSKDAQGNPALSVTDTIRADDVTNTTLDGLFSDIGFKPVNGSFEDGGTINNRWETLLLKSNGSFYQWMGALPKVVPAGSTPASTGGISPTAWVDRSDLSLRSQLSSSSLPGTSLVKHSNGETVQQLINRVNRCLLSSFNGDLQQALNNADKVLIDQDYNLSSVITVNSGNSIECINGSVINHTGGKLKTAVVGSPQYWRDVDGNRQIAITADVASGATQITVSDASTIVAGQKLLLKNGYCDMWRVLETSTNPRVAVDTLTYRSEIVEVISKSGNTLTVSKTKYAYPVTVTTYGYLSDENALSDYNGYTRPSVSKILYTDIKLKLDVVIPSTNTSRLIEFAYIDGLDLSADIRSSANVQALMQIQSSIVNIHDLKIDGHTDVALWVMETSQGNLNNLRATNWKGGSDTPFCALNLSPVVVSNVYSESSVIYGDSSAFYLNTSDGGSVTGVKSKNLGKVIDLSFSRGCVASDAQGDNADFAFGSYCSSKCIMSNGVISGYCALTSSSGDYKASLIQPAFTTDCVWQNVKRYGDQGYGSIFINNVINAQIDGLFCPQTLMFTIIGTKAAEPASGYVAVNARNCNVGKFTRISNYYDSADEFGYFYPKTKYHNISVTGTVDVGGECGQTDSFDFYTNSVVTLGKNILGINISGHVNSLTCDSANKAQCYPFVGNLKMEAKPASGVFNSVDSQISGGSNFSTAFMNGALISDVYSRKTYVNSSNKGTVPTWLLT